MNVYLLNPTKKFTIEIIVLFLFLMLGTAEVMKAQDFTVTVTAGPSAGGSVSGGGTYTNGASATLTATPNTGYIFYKWSNGNTNNPYTITVTSDSTLTAIFAISIGSKTDWNNFCNALSGGNTYDGQTIVLTNNITINKMAGKVNNPTGVSTNPFRGTFDGGGHTLTLSGGDFGTPDTLITQKYCAPFYHVENGTFKNLIVDGDIYMKTQSKNTYGEYQTGKFAAGFISSVTGESNYVYNCVSAVKIHSTKNDSSDGTHGGFLGIISQSGTHRITFEGCAFIGQFLGKATTTWAGFVAWREYKTQGNTVYTNTVTFTNCLCAPTKVDIGSGTNKCTFCRASSTSGAEYNNCYYTHIIQKNDGGKLADTISAGNFITVERSGSESAIYNVSGITAYSTGIIYNGILYGGSGDDIGLSLSYNNPGYPLEGYTATNGSLSGSSITGTNDEYTLSSITGNVTINASGNLPFDVTATANPSPNDVNTVQVTTNSGTSGSQGASSSALVNSGATVTLTATAGTNWRFYKWNNGSTSASQTINNVTSHASFTAYFAPTSISNAAEWGYFCDAVNDGFSYDGMTVTLTNDITIDRMAGTSSSHPFMGTFDGQTHTITLSGGDFGTSAQNTPNKFCAPFQYVNGGTFINLRVDGDTYTYAKFTSGLIGSAAGTIIVRNCVSALNIHSSVNGDGSHGGFLGIIDNDGSSITFEGCAFVGQLLGSSTYNCGGFIGWREYRSGEHQSFNTVNFTNCFSAATAVTLNMLTTGNSRTFGRERTRTGATHTNCYYTTTIQGNDQDTKQAYTITGDDGVSVDIQGSSTYYNVSNIKTYGTDKGIDFNGIHYAANGENVDLQLSYTPPVDHHITGYFASDGGILNGTALTGTNDAYTLTMPASNTIIEVTTSQNSTWVEAVTTNPSVGNYETDISGNVTIRSNRGLAWLISVVNGLNGQTPDNLSGKTVTLTENVDMNEYIWVPIGTPEHAFAGTFNGGYHTIDGLHIIASEESAAGAPVNTGLLGFTVSGATIKNTLVVDSHFFNNNTSGNIGGIVGNNAGTIQNSFSDVTLSGSAPNKGGLAGTNSGTLRHSYTMVISGIYGSNSGTVTNCYSKAASDATPGTGFTAPNYEYGKYDKNNIVIVSGTPEPLVDLLNNGNNDGKWILPKKSTHVNGGYPVLVPTSGGSKTGEALAVASHSGTKALYYGTAEEMIQKYNSGSSAATATRPADIYVYGSGDLGNTVPSNENMRIFIDEDAAVTQNNIASAITATVGITIDNSATNGNMGRDWHTFSTPLADVPLGITYPYPDDVLPYNAVNDSVHYKMNFGGGYFTSDLNLYKNDVDFYEFHESQYHWINLKRNPVSHWHVDDNHAYINDYTGSTNLVPGNGYLLAIGDNTIAKKKIYMNATGTMKDGDVSVTVTNSGAHLTGYNFLGNPYQSYLDFKRFVDYEENGIKVNEVALWSSGAIGYRSYFIYDADEGDFVGYLVDDNSEGFSLGSEIKTNQLLHPHQGFFVIKNSRTTDNAATVKFTNDMRNTTGTSSYRDAQPNYPLVNLICTDSDGKREVSVIEVNRPSMAGAIKMKELLNRKAYMYIHWDNEDFSSMFIDHTPEYLPIWFKSAEEGVFTMTWSTANDNFGYLHLVDNLTGADIDMLTTDSYTFQSKPSDLKARFRLVFSALGIEEDETVEGESFAFISNGELIVTGNGELSLIDFNGRVLATERIAGEQSRISLPSVADGIYLLRLTNGKETKVQKIVIR